MDPLLETPPTEVTFSDTTEDFDNNTMVVRVRDNINNRVDSINLYMNVYDVHINI